jgi:pimeloyl-ACP methyl ester carboxylesterase
MKLHFVRWNQTASLGQGPTPHHSQSSGSPKVVFLHGMGGTGSLWRPIGAHLESKMDVLALDQRGHGKSQVSAHSGSRIETHYTPLDYGRDIIETLEDLEFHPTWIVGHSMGVRSAMACAHLKPEWVKGLILVDLGFSGVAGGGLGENLARFIRVLPREFSSRDEARSFMEQHCPDPSMAQYLMAVSVREPETGRIHFPFDHAALIQTIYAARDVSIRHWVREVGQKNIPILILRGANSLVWTHEEFLNEQRAFSDLPSIQFIEFENAGHGLPFEQRQRFIQLIEETVLQKAHT